MMHIEQRGRLMLIGMGLVMIIFVFALALAGCTSLPDHAGPGDPISAEATRKLYQDCTPHGGNVRLCGSPRP